MDFRTFTRIIITRWKIVVTALLVCLVGAAAVTALQTKTYRSSATILMSFSGTTNINDVYEATQASQQRLSSYAEIAGGNRVAQRAIQQLGVQMTAGELVQNTTVVYTPESLLFRLTVVDSDAQRVAALAGAMADQFAALVPDIEAPTAGNIPAPTAITDGQQPAPAAPADGQPAAAAPAPSQPVPAATATVVERPTVPDGPFSPIPLRNGVLGLVAGVLLAIALALARESTDRTVRNRETLDRVSGLPTLAQLPSLRKPGPIGTYVATHSRHRSRGRDPAFDEALRAFRSRLLALTETQPHSVLITGPATGEGATTTSLNLARSFTETGGSILLVEGDPRQPAIASLVGIDSEIGLTDVLSDLPLLNDAVHATSETDLWVLASRNATGTDRHLNNPALEQVVEKLSSSFDRVVIDGPPALATADTGLLASAAEVTVLVVRAGRTTVDEVEAALENLRGAGGNVVGTVLTAAPISRKTKNAIRVYRAKVGSAA